MEFSLVLMLTQFTNSPVVTDIISRRYSTQQERTSAIARVDYKFNNRNKLVFDGAFINLVQNQFRYSSDTSLTLARTGIGQGRVTETPRGATILSNGFTIFRCTAKTGLQTILPLTTPAYILRQPPMKTVTRWHLLPAAHYRQMATVLQQPVTM